MSTIIMTLASLFFLSMVGVLLALGVWVTVRFVEIIFATS